jgi:N-acetyl-alpha-D-glucosaminyl L-malate synthase BshA
LGLRIGITCFPSHGGSGVIATELGKDLGRRGHEVHFISYETPFRLREYHANIHYHEVEVPSYPVFKYPPYLLALSNKMVEVARHAGLDLIHVHYAIPHAASAYLAREVCGRSFKVVTTLHGTDITLVGSIPSFADMTVFSINQSDGVTAVSESLRQETMATFPAVHREIVTIRNFVDVSEFVPRASADLRGLWAPAGEMVIMHMSNFRPVKRIERVVRIFAAVNRKIPSRLVLVGDGPDVALARATACAEGVAERVVFLGLQDRVAPVLAAADLFLLPSDKESFGQVALEAMACGVPVVASRIGGLPEVVADGETGYLLEPDDTDGMAAAALRILGDREVHRALGERARAVAEERFAAGKVVPLYEDYYVRVLSGTGAARA